MLKLTTPKQAKSLAGSLLGLKLPQQPKNSRPNMYALGRLPAGVMNKTEARYASHLEARKVAGEVLWFKFEGMKFRLADNTFYSPDFAVLLASGELEQHEVKGVWLDDARVKIKVAADMYPMRFLGITAKKGGGWNVEHF